MDADEQEEGRVEVAARLERAEPDTLETIFRDYHAQVFRAAFRVTGNASDAEDVLQTVFLRLVRSERGGALAGNPSSYLRRAAVNAALDVLRNRRNARTSSLEDQGNAQLHDPDPGPERRHGACELRGRLRKAVARLSPRVAEVFVLRYFEGYPNHEIARMMGTSRSTVAVMLHRARSRLQREVREWVGGAS